MDPTSPIAKHGCNHQTANATPPPPQQQQQEQEPKTEKKPTRHELEVPELRPVVAVVDEVDDGRARQGQRHEREHDAPRLVGVGGL